MSSQAIGQRFRVSRGGCWQCVADCRIRLAEVLTFSQVAYNGHCLTLARALAAGGKRKLGGVVFSGSSKVTRLNTHNMAEKIEMFAGWDWDGSAIVGLERNIHIDKECTVVVHDGKAERVFTESEVRAILRDLLAASEDGPFMPNYDRMDEMVKFHGLSFDPA